MNINTIVTAFSSTAHKIGFKVMKHSPEILVVTGVIGAVTAAVTACVATTKVSAVLDKTKEELDSVHKVLNGEIKTDTEYTEEDGKKDIAIIYTHTGLKLIKLYAPAVIIGALSITAILSSNNILRKRNAALAGAYAAIDASFKDYRNRVIDRFGDRVDKELKYGIKAQKIEETITDENGNSTTVEKEVDVIEPGEHGLYTKIFDEYSRYWSSTPDYNRMFVIGVERHANDKLNANGYLFLNDVYDMLDIPRTKEGQVVGWVKNPKSGDSAYVDFGIFNAYSKAHRAFINGHEKSIWLDFNVQGNILDEM